MNYSPTPTYAFFKGFKFLIFSAALLSLGIIYISNNYLLLIVLIFGPIFLFIFAYIFWYYISSSYKIEEGNLIYNRGVFSKKTDFIELYRIKDYTLDRPFGLRLIGVSNIIILTSDKTDPVFKISGIKVKDEFISKLRQLVEQERKKKNVYEID